MEKELTAGFGERIRLVVRRIGSKEDVAQKLGVARATLYRWIAEESMPPFDCCAMLCQLAGADMYWLAFNQASVWFRAIGQHPVSMPARARQNA